MTKDETVARIRRRIVVVVIAVLSIAAAAQSASDPAPDAEAAPVVGILHPMPPIGNIDCCH